MRFCFTFALLTPSTFVDHRILLVGTRSELLVYELDDELSLNLVASMVVRCPIVGLTVPPGEISKFATLDQYDGVRVWSYDSSKHRLNMIAKDPQIRLGADIVFQDDSHLVLLDKLGAATVLHHHPEPPESRTVFITTSASAAASRDDDEVKHLSDTLHVSAHAILGHSASRMKMGTLLRRQFVDPDFYTSSAQSIHPSNTCVFSSYLGSVRFMQSLSATTTAVCLELLRRMRMLHPCELLNGACATSSPPKENVIDGDVVFAYLALSVDQQKDLVAAWPTDIEINGGDSSKSSHETLTRFVHKLRAQFF